MPSYKYNGNTYDIPADKVADFEAKYQDATMAYKDGDTIYDIPVSKREKFLSKYPNAIQWDDQTQKDTLETNLADFSAQYGDFMSEYESFEKHLKAPEMEPEYLPNYEAHMAQTDEYNLRRTEREKMLKEYFSNPIVIKEREGRAGDARLMAESFAAAAGRMEQENPSLARKAKASNAAAMNPRGGMIGFIEDDVKQYNEDRANYETARRFATEAQEIYAAPSKYDESIGVVNFLRGAKDVANNADFWTMGMAGIADNLNARDALVKVQEKLGSISNLTEDNIDQVLSPSEKALVTAWATNVEAQARRAEDLSRGYQAGQGATESLGFMAQFLLTGGVGETAAKGATAGMKKWLAGQLGKMSAGAVKSTVKGASKGVLGAVESITKAAVQTPLMPSTYSNISEVMLEIDNSGKLIEADKAFWNGLADSMIETWSENAGGMVEEILGVPLKLGKSAWNKALGETSFGKWGQSLTRTPAYNLMKQAGWNGYIGELGEEWLGNSVRTLTGLDPDALKDFATVDQQLITMTSFAPMAVFGLGASTAQYKAAKNRAANAAEALSGIMKEAGYTDEQIRFTLDDINASTPRQLSETLTPVVNQIARDTGFGSDAFKAAMKYADAMAKYRTLDGFYQREQESKMLDARTEIESKTGQLFYQIRDTGKPSVTGDGNVYIEEVRVVENSDGSRYFVVGQSKDGTLAAVDEQGGKRFLTEDEITQKLNDGSITSDRTMMLRDFLRAEVVRKQQDAEQIRMTEESRNAVNQIKQIAQPGVQVNVGTVEAPISGIIRQVMPDRVIVETEAGVNELTWEEAGRILGVDATPRTDDEIEAGEVAQIEAAHAERETRLAQTTDEAAGAEIEALDAQAEKSIAEPLPLKADGSVDQTSLWNQNPEQWAQWNDEQRQDGGVNSLGYINSAISREQTKVNKLTNEYNAEPDFDVRSGMEQEIKATNERLNRLVLLQQKYAPLMQAEVQQTEVTAEQSAPAMAPVAEAEQNDSVNQVRQTLADLYNDPDLSESEIEDYINANVEKAQSDLDKHIKKAPKMGTDLAKYKADRAKHQEKTAELEQQRDFWREVQSYIEVPSVSDMDLDPQNALEFTAAELTSREGIKLLPDSFRRHTGWGSEIGNFLSVLRTKEKGGLTLEAAGERLMELDRENNTGFFDQNDPNAGLNAILDVLGGARTSGDISGYIKANREQTVKEEVAAARNAMMEEVAAVQGFEQEGLTEERTDFTPTPDNISSEEKVEDIGDIPNNIGESSLDEDMPDFTNTASAYFPDEVMRQKFSVMRDRINQWHQKLGVKVRIMETLDDVVNPSARGQISTGWKVYGYFDPATREVAFYLPDFLSIKGRDLTEEEFLREIDATYIHEVVSHRGLRGLLGEDKYGELCDMVWDAMPEDQKNRYLYYPGVNGNTRAAADEFIAHFAENVDYNNNRTLWDKIVDFIKGLFNSVELPVDISNESLADLLRMSYSRLAKNAAAVDTDSNQQAEGNTMFRAEDGSLVGMHNISEEKLKKIIRQGGAANPSTAVIDIDRQMFGSYGEISFIMPSSLVDAGTGRNAGTFTADAWTPTYPPVSKRFSDDKLQRAYWRDISAIPEEMSHEVRMAFDSWLDNRNASGLAYMFLHERGEAPEMVRVEAKFPQEIKDKVSAILGEGRTGLYDLSAEEKQAMLELYIQENFGGNREEFDKSIADRIQRIEDRLSTGKVPSFVEKRITLDLQWMKEHAYNYDELSKFVSAITADIRHAGEVNDAATTNRALDYIKDNGLEKEFDRWKESLNDRYGIKEYLFDGYTPSGNQRWLPNTVENASRLMNKQGLAGATGMAASFNRFVATLAPKKKTLSDIRASKDRLVEDEKLVDDFREKWSEVFFDLGVKCQPDAKGYEDYGLARLTEAAQKKNPGAYLKKEYGVELSQEDLQKLSEMIKAIKTEFPARYFETKFQRPVYLNEFAAAVMPTTTSEDIKQAVSEAGLPIFEYDSTVEGSRKEATLKATEGEGIRFRMSNDNQAIFVSNAAKAVEGIKQEKATPEQWLKMLEKAGGLKAGEDKWMGLSDWLKASDKKTLTKQEVLGFINENMIIIEEQHYSEGDDSLDAKRQEIQEALQAIYDEYVAESEDMNDDMFMKTHYDYAIQKLADELGYTAFNAPFINNNALVELDFYEDDLDTLHELSNRLGLEKYDGTRNINDTRLSYTSEGLTDRREIALTIPTIEPWDRHDELHFGDAGDGRAVAWVRFGETEVTVQDATQQRLNEIYDRLAELEMKVSSSTGITQEEYEERSRLRKERDELQEIEPKTQRVLVIDEIQSNRHQEGREKGYKPAIDVRARLNEIAKQLKELGKIESTSTSGLTDEQHEERDKLLDEEIRLIKAGPIPDAPFDKNWHELAMKRMLRYAAENGYDIIAWTKGEQQAERYNIGSYVSSIEAQEEYDGNRDFGFYMGESDEALTVTVDENGTVVSADGHLSQAVGRPLADLVGKEMAVKMMQMEEYDVLEDTDIKVGNEGMKGFYDKMLPAFMNKYGKKWGVKVEDIDLPNLGKSGYTMHSVPVTEEMKASVMEGQVMFRVRGDNESALDFHKDTLIDFKRNFNTPKPTTVVDVNDRNAVAEALGYTPEEFTDKMYQQIIDGVNDGGKSLYDAGKKRIAIFAIEDSRRSADVEENIFHENTHGIIAEHPELLELGEWLWENSQPKSRQQIKQSILDSGYYEGQYHNEMLSRYTGLVLAKGMAGAVMQKLPADQQKHWELILNEFGYEPEREDGNRRRRFESDTRGMGTPGYGQERQQEVSDNGASETRFRTTEITPEVQAEMDVISATALMDGTYLKAPNGADTNLTAEQWALVRTKNFKKWFGDWENDPENASKVVDENGEPKVVYHGTNLTVANRGVPFWTFYEDQHFGTRSQAEEMARAGRPDAERKVYETFLNIRNIKRVKDAPQDWILTHSEYWEPIFNEAKAEGYDGLVYQNDWEDSDSKDDSFVVFDPSQIKSATDNTGEFSEEEGDIRFRVVTDPAKIEELENGPKVKVYRAMQLIDGKLYPPMSAKVDGQLRQPIELGQWEEAEERPDLADDKGYFKLDKGNKKSLKARYNPYFHTSYTPLNDQFSEAQDRPNLVTVEVEIPASELTSGYKADKAKDSVGEKEWKAGVIQGKLSGTRKVILSRWDKPVRIVPDSEVADVIVKMFEGKDIVMPSNVVTPSLREELEKRGVPFVETNNKGKKLQFTRENYEDIPQSWYDSAEQAQKAIELNGVDEITDRHFKDYAGSVILPSPSKALAEKILSGDKKVLIKKGIFAKNEAFHDFTPEQSRKILNDALYAPNRYGQTQPISRPLNWVAIKTGDRNAIIVLEVNETKDYLEIVSWHTLDARNLRRIERQAKREGGEILILDSEESLAASLSALPSDLSSEGKDTDNLDNTNDSEENISLRVTGTPTEDVVAEGLVLSVQDFTKLAGDIYEGLSSEYRTMVANNFVNGSDFQEEIFKIPSRLVEKENFSDDEIELAKMIADKVQGAVLSTGIELSRPLTTNEALWMLDRSINPPTDVLGHARASVVADNLGFSPAMIEQVKNNERDIRYRAVSDSEAESLADVYNQSASYYRNRLYEVFVDQYDSVDGLMKAIEDATGKPAKSFEDVRYTLNQLPAKSGAKAIEMSRKYIIPMWDAVKNLVSKYNLTEEKIARYTRLKHGLERNEEFPRRDAREFYRNAYNKKIAAIEADDSLEDFEKLSKKAKAQKDLDFHLESIERGSDAKFQEFREKDYSGIMAAYEDKYDNLADAEQAAREEVESFEAGKEAEITELWKRINALNKATIKIQYESGQMSKDLYNKLKEQFKYYVPLRGFMKDTAEDVFDYYSHEFSGFEGTAIRAEGRTTEAESPFGHMAAMMSSAIVSGEKNASKLPLYYFALNRKDNGLLMVQDVWYVKRADSDEWQLSLPPVKRDSESIADYGQRVSAWEESMKSLMAEGKAKKGKQNLSLEDVVHIEDKSEREHYIRVMVNGQEKWMIVNGNPRAAQAINGLLNIESDPYFSKFLGKLMRELSQMSTSYNPEFWMTNLERDFMTTFATVSLSEDKEYRQAFMKNYKKAWDVVKLLPKLKDGTLGDTGREGVLKEAVAAGLQTGYSHIKANEIWDKEMEQHFKDIDAGNAKKAVKEVLGKLQTFSESMELVSRFAVYMTSREMGRSIEESVADGKEVTANFNRKGSGRAITFEEAKKLTTADGKTFREKFGERKGAVAEAVVVAISRIAQYGRKHILFFNASIQGLDKWMRLAKKKKGNAGKLAAYFGGQLALGFVMSLLYGLDDDDEYQENISDYDRRNNFMIGGNGYYIKIALPHDVRAFYGMGDILYNFLSGNYKHLEFGESAAVILKQMLSISPVNLNEGWQGLLPDWMSPGIEAGAPYDFLGWTGTNKNFAGMPIRKETPWLTEDELKNTPKYTLAGDYTWEWLVDVSEALNRFSGGNYKKSGMRAFDIDPARIQHYIEGWTGGIGRTTGNLATFLGQIVGEDEWKAANTPFLNKVFTITDERSQNKLSNSQFYAYRNAAETSATNARAFEKDKETKLLKKEKASDEYKIYQIYNSRYKKAEQEYNKQLKVARDEQEEKRIKELRDANRKRFLKELSDKGLLINL